MNVFRNEEHKERTMVPPAAVTPLGAGVGPLAAYFDANAGRHRVVALLSPT